MTLTVQKIKNQAKKRLKNNYRIKILITVKYNY